MPKPTLFYNSDITLLKFTFKIVKVRVRMLGRDVPRISGSTNLYFIRMTE